MSWIRVGALALGASAVSFAVANGQSSVPAAQAASAVPDSTASAAVAASASAEVLGSSYGAPAASATPADQSPAVAPPATPPVVDAERVAFVVRTKKPTFVATSVGTVEFGIVGALVSMSAGDQIVAANNIDDPANALAAQIANIYAANHGGLTVEAPFTLVDQQDLTGFPEMKARYVVVVATYYWGYSYFPFDWAHYGVDYGAILSVEDRVTNKEILKARCFVKPVKSGAPNHDGLLQNGAAGLKSLLATAGQACLGQMQKSTPELSLPTAQS